VVNKIDLPDAKDRLDIVRELFAERFPIHVIAAEYGTGMEICARRCISFECDPRLHQATGQAGDMTSPSPVRRAAPWWKWRRAFTATLPTTQVGADLGTGSSTARPSSATTFAGQGRGGTAHLKPGPFRPSPAIAKEQADEEVSASVDAGLIALPAGTGWRQVLPVEKFDGAGPKLGSSWETYHDDHNLGTKVNPLSS